jgi:hypothetical protein
MSKLKSFEQFLSERDRTEDIQQDVINTSTPDVKGAEEAEEEAEEVQGTEEITEAKNANKDSKKIIKLVNKNIEAGSDKDDALMDVLLDGGYFDETSDEYIEFVASIDSKLVDPVDTFESKETEEEIEEVEEEAEEEVEEEAEEEAEEAKQVSEMLQEVYEACKNEAKVYEDDAHDDHTVESYMAENAALIAALAAKSLTEMKEEYSTEAYEAACNGMIESYTKKMNEMKETESAEDAGAVE